MESLFVNPFNENSNSEDYITLACDWTECQQPGCDVYNGQC